MAETGQAQPLLHVCTAVDPQQPPGAPREEHLIPYVPQIVPSIDVAAGATPVCTLNQLFIGGAERPGGVSASPLLNERTCC